MSKILFHSSISEKNNLKKKLLDAHPAITDVAQSDEILSAIFVTEDALLLHEMHKLLQTLESTFRLLHGGQLNSISSKDYYIREAFNDIDVFYKKLAKRKKKLGSG